MNIRRLVEIAVRFLGFSFLLYTLPGFLYFLYLLFLSVTDKIYDATINRAGIFWLSVAQLCLLILVYSYLLRYGRVVTDNLYRRVLAEADEKAEKDIAAALFTKCIGLWLLLLSLRKIFTVLVMIVVYMCGFTNEIIISMDPEPNADYKTLFFSLLTIRTILEILLYFILGTVLFLKKGILKILVRKL